MQNVMHDVMGHVMHYVMRCVTGTIRLVLQPIVIDKPDEIVIMHLFQNGMEMDPSPLPSECHGQMETHAELRPHRACIQAQPVVIYMGANGTKCSITISSGSYSSLLSSKWRRQVESHTEYNIDNQGSTILEGALKYAAAGASRGSSTSCTELVIEMAPSPLRFAKGDVDSPG
jgi:hypothetical protein